MLHWSMQEIDSGNFDEILSSKDIVVIDFWAPWCGPCRALGPTMEQVANEVAEMALVVKVNIDDNSDLADRFDIQSIPTIIFFKGGSEISRTVGMATKNDIITTIYGLRTGE